MLYFVMINCAAFVLYGWDKRQAIKKRWRVPELQLLLLAVLGGSAGAWAAMRVWQHKTQHKKFAWGVPALLAAQLLTLLYVYLRLL